MRWQLAVFICCACAWSCEASDEKDSAMEPAGALETDPGGDLYSAGMTKVGELSGVVLSLDDMDPILGFSGEYTWFISVESPTGGPVVDRVEAEASMPQHGHGTLPKQVETSLEAGQGTLGPLNLYMGGLWLVEVRLYEGDVLVDTVSFEFGVEG